ncbi:gamma-glutamylcyclotransferase family protein [Sphingopyxis indica]|uniref:Gamma-glutamyl cyclotransferase, AIG2-like n=1 Tax=Sphingopyxis indica TaxID=436663 RepID=A0A239GYH0_9SPHN|nr:gamma-glutamylcyclotransferase family protein [Sphingopyxis indica]SNS74256.1 Gamma-glutamyl cyclotransferase, AIG2-like [Sphingopyxis indica]
MVAAHEPLFAYGSLQRADVQREQIGRQLVGTADALAGFRLGRLAIDDPEVVRRSGETHYPVLTEDAAASQRVAGTLYWLTKTELAAADAYEAEDYERRRVTLESGRTAWAYVAAPGLETE